MTYQPTTKGLYIHVPFCGQRCIYCDFYSTLSAAQLAEQYIEALGAELKQYAGTRLHSVYWGGGTPSMLSLEQLDKIVSLIYNIFGEISNLTGENLPPHSPEITIEVNPDDATPNYLRGLRSLGFNRLSMGVQTFDEQRLRWLHRRHTAAQAMAAVETARSVGFEDVSIDLIYALPEQSLSAWEDDVKRALSLPITHLSSYALIVEPGTPLYRLCQQGKVTEVSDETQLAMFERLCALTAAQGWHHYELSNFSLPGHEALHNTGYWRGWPYIGCGPGAHGYDGKVRTANRPDLKDYVAHPGHPTQDIEILTATEKFEELILTRLRLAEGLDWEEVPAERREALQRAAAPWLEQGYLRTNQGRLQLTEKAWFISDTIFSDLI